MGKTTYMPPSSRARTRVTGQDLDAIIAAGHSLASLDSLDQLRQRAVELVAALVPATMVAWNEVDLNGRRIEAVMSPTLARFTGEGYDTLSAAFIEHIADHPVIAYYQRSGDGRPYAISDFLSAAAFRQTGIYRNFYRHLGAEDQLSFVLPDPFLIVGVALNRKRRGFTARDRRLCNLLRPHLLQAYRQVESSARMKRMASSFEQAATDHGLGTIRLDEHGQPSETSFTARGILHHFFDLHGAPSLPREINDWLARDPHTNTPAELVLRRQDGRRLLVHRTPAPSGDLLLLSEQPGAPPDTRKLGLTAREAQALELIRQGLPTKRIAAALGISPRTAEKHIQHGLDKLGVRTRLQAIALLEHASTRGLTEAQEGLTPTPGRRSL